MTWKALLGLGLILIFLPFAVFLRPAYADSPCRDVSEAYRSAASARDGGIAFDTLYKKLVALRLNDMVTAEQYADLLDMLIFVYTTNKTPAEIADMVKKACQASIGEVDA
jgi:hypothetical protein